MKILYDTDIHTVLRLYVHFRLMVTDHKNDPCFILIINVSDFNYLFCNNQWLQVLQECAGRRVMEVKADKRFQCIGPSGVWLKRRQLLCYPMIVWFVCSQLCDK
jgi:hypothetical protein